MPRLIALPDRNGPPGGSRLWFNPDHIVSLSPHVNNLGSSVTLGVDLKLTGLPLIVAWLGNYSTRADADAAWHSFLLEITTDPNAS